MADPYNIPFWFHNIKFLDGMNNLRVLSFGMLRYLIWCEYTKVSEERSAPIFRSKTKQTKQARLFYSSDWCWRQSRSSETSVNFL
jgi:hypothetical protein